MQVGCTSDRNVFFVGNEGGAAALSSTKQFTIDRSGQHDPELVLGFQMVKMVEYAAAPCGDEVDGCTFSLMRRH